MHDNPDLSAFPMSASLHTWVHDLSMLSLEGFHDGICKFFNRKLLKLQKGFIYYNHPSVLVLVSVKCPLGSSP